MRNPSVPIVDNLHIVGAFRTSKWFAEVKPVYISIMPVQVVYILEKRLA